MRLKNMKASVIWSSLCLIRVPEKRKRKDNVEKVHLLIKVPGIEVARATAPHIALTIS